MLAVLSVVERASQAAIIGKDSPGASSLQPRNTVGTVVGMVYEHQGQPGDGTYFKFTRDLPVPAACSQAAWAPTTPYIRERFLFDWKERGVTDKKFFICELLDYTQLSCPLTLTSRWLNISNICHHKGRQWPVKVLGHGYHFQYDYEADQQPKGVCRHQQLRKQCHLCLL